MASRLTNKTVAHLRSLRATMSQKSSVPQAISFVSQVLKRDTLDMSPCPFRLLPHSADLTNADGPDLDQSREAGGR